MDIEIKTWLYDVLSAIHEIDSFFVDRPKTYIAFQNDVRTKRAIEHNLEIIGEAINRIIKKDPDFTISKSLIHETVFLMAMILCLMISSGVL